MAKNKVKQIICGVQFSPSFKLIDSWGAIADNILYNNKYFSSEYFKHVSSQSSLDCVLYNDQKGKEHSLRLNTSNLIYTHVIQSDFESELSEFIEKVKDFIVPKIIQQNNLITRRIGVVYVCEIAQKGIEEFAAKYFKPEFSNISDFRFSKKESTVNGTLWSKKADFINKIYTIGNIDESEKGIILDYQYHYNPPQTYITDKIDKVIWKSKDILDKEILISGV